MELKSINDFVFYSDKPVYVVKTDMKYDELRIPYYSPMVIDGTLRTWEHRPYQDYGEFYVEYIDFDGKTKKVGFKVEVHKEEVIVNKNTHMFTDNNEALNFLKTFLGDKNNIDELNKAREKALSNIVTKEEISEKFDIPISQLVITTKYRLEHGTADL